MKCQSPRSRVAALLATVAFIFAAKVGGAFVPNPRNNGRRPLGVGHLCLSKAPEEESTSTQRPGTLRVFGPDQKGIVAAFSQLLYGHGCGIISSEQSTDTATNMFFQRLYFDYTTMHTDEITLETGVREVCERLHMQNQLDWRKTRKKIAIMVSKYDHVLWEILLRHKAGELDCDISVIISNHNDLKPVADTFNIP